MAPEAMKHPLDECPDLETLAAYLDGRLAPGIANASPSMWLRARRAISSLPRLLRRILSRSRRAKPQVSCAADGCRTDE